MDQITYTCTKCGRESRLPRARVLQLIANQRGCQICGGALKFPPGVGGTATSRDEDSDSPPAVRTPTKRPAVSGAPAPPTAAARAPRREAECPTCLRSIRADARDAEAVLKCGFCGARVRAPLEGRGFRPPPVEGAPASSAEVRAAVAKLPGDELGEIARDALLARAKRGEVSRKEALELATGLAALESWQPGDRAFLPLSPDVAAHALPSTVFAGLGREPSSSRELVFVTGIETGITTKGVLNIVGTAAFLTTGMGFVVYGGSQGNTRRKVVRLRVSLVASGEGVALGLSRQVEDGPAERVSAKEDDALRERIACVVPALRHYLALLAVFGTWARGTPIATATAPAIERRLTALGEPLASRAGSLSRKLRSGFETVQR